MAARWKYPTDRTRLIACSFYNSCFAKKWADHFFVFTANDIGVNQMKDKRLHLMILSALMAALCCAATLVVQIPAPANGYINLGDCAVLLAAWLLGPIYGAAAAGVGCMLADILAGFAYYAPGTLVIKAAGVVLACWLLKLAGGKSKHTAVALALSGTVAQCAMAALYFLYASVVLGQGYGAAAEIPGNLVQGVIGICAGTALYLLLNRSGALKRILGKNNL